MGAYVDPPNTITLTPFPTDSGHEIASRYAEAYWLPVVGPSALWIARRCALLLEAGVTEVDAMDLSFSMGLGAAIGPHAPVVRSLIRLQQFNVARYTRSDDRHELALRLRWPDLSPRQVERLPLSLRSMHDGFALAATA